MRNEDDFLFLEDSSFLGIGKQDESHAKLQPKHHKFEADSSLFILLPL